MTWMRAAALADLTENTPLGVVVDDTPIVLVRQGETVRALYDECSHAQVKLSVGFVDAEECSLVCLAHGAEFDLETGAAKSLPAFKPVRIFPARIEGDGVLVDLDTDEEY